MPRSLVLLEHVNVLELYECLTTITRKRSETMGLDMFLKGRESRNEEPKQLAYWRKHPNLHGFIVQTFAGGKDECQEIPLTARDLEKVLRASEEDKLPHTTGFFFGQSLPEDKVSTATQIRDAIRWLQASPKRKLFYRASW